MINEFRRMGVVTLALAFVGTAYGCSKPVESGVAAQLAKNPADVCVSKETVDTLKSVILTNSLTTSDQASVNYGNQLTAGATVSLDVPVLDSFDKDVKKVVCSAKATFVWPNGISARLKQISPDVAWGSDTSQIQYTIQPQAGGGGFVYTVASPGAANIIGSVRIMVSTLIQSDQNAIEAAQASKAAAAEAVAAARDAAAEAISSNGNTNTTSASPAAASSRSYACAATAEDGSVSGGVMSLTLDEARACINNRTAYARTVKGGMVRAMVVDAQHRASVLSFSPDRQTFMRQDFILNAAQYAEARSRATDLITIACPVTSDDKAGGDVQTRLAAAHHALGGVLRVCLENRLFGIPV